MLEIPDKDRLIVALDVPDTATAEKLVTDLDDTVSFYKVGLQLIYAGGIDFARDLVAAGRKVFLDTKLLDIDNTVAHAVESIVQLGATFATVHAYPQAMRAAVGARGDASLKLLGVTVLTSMDDSDLVEAGYGRTASELVAARAGLAQDAGMDGIVASPAEAATIRRIVGPAMAIVTPGIRPAGADRGDQKRVATPTMAIEAGADYLVVGRPINAAEKPRAAAEAIAAEISAAVSARKRK